MRTQQPERLVEEYLPRQLAADAPSAEIAQLISWCVEGARRRAAGHRAMLSTQHAWADAAREAALAAAEQLARSRNSQELAIARWRRRQDHEGNSYVARGLQIISQAGVTIDIGY